MRFAWLVLVSFGSLAGIAAASSCQGLSEGEGCQNIPAGGCPEDRGGTCDDPTCAAIYACNDGLWSVAQSCGRSAGTGGSGGSAATGATGGSTTTSTGTGVCSTQDPDAGCTVVNLDTTDTATDCTPDLMDGDCPWQVAQGSCVQCVCLAGCLDFYKCTPPGWVAVAYCDDNGDFITSNQ